MKRVILDDQQRVLSWVGKKIDAPNFAGDAKAIGWEVDGELQGGVVFENWNGPNIYMHVAINEGCVVTRSDLRIAFAYPFVQLKCNRITGLVRVDNRRAQRFDEHLGFRVEGRLRHAHADGTDMFVYGMVKEDCRWVGVTK